jgi:hypothetical protein
LVRNRESFRHHSFGSLHNTECVGQQIKGERMSSVDENEEIDVDLFGGRDVIDFDPVPRVVIGTVCNFKLLKSKHNEDMCFILIEINDEKFHMTVFPSVFKQSSFDLKNNLKNGIQIKITGVMDSEGKNMLIAENIEEP